ncbi:tyrosine-type recombinase/integrase [Actinoplanes sp. NPDC049599]|uniref:tyrosine-type recombinase/integrase n=1 Tax=Actinoplanes sp. NPDC049599 TaxID=3363903 RepID=UPI0037B1BB0F
MGRRAPNGSSSIYQGADGLWHTWVHAGTKANGSPDRKHIKRSTAGEVKVAAESLRDRIARGQVVAGKPETVEQWLLHWLEHIIEPNRAYKTHAGYRSLITVHVIPAIGQWRLDGTRNRLEPEYVEAMYTKMKASVSEAYVAQCHRVLKRAFKAAVRRGRASRNVCEMIDPPQWRRKRIAAHELDAAQAILNAAMTDQRPARWLLGILLGLRQGEALGLRWHRLHLAADPPYLAVEKQIQRHTWKHGCADPAACVEELRDTHDKPLCRRTPCPPRYEHGCAGGACGKTMGWRCPDRRQVAGCSRHQRACPAPHRAGCTDHARWCPQRAGGGLVEQDVKSESGEREIPLPAPLPEVLLRAREQQIQWLGSRGLDWDPQGLVFMTDTLRPIDPKRDHEAWERLLDRAGVKDSRLHAARHDAATYMIAAGVDISVVQAILGHANISTTRGYVDVAREVKRQAVEKIAASLLDGQLTALLGGPKEPSRKVLS